MGQSEIRTVTVPLGKKTYTISIGAGILQEPSLVHEHIHTKQVLIVSNHVIAEHYLPALMHSLKSADAGMQIEVVMLPEGESNKNQQAIDSIYDCLIENKFSRDCMIIALGGGIVGDITGFAAASYQRGVTFIQIPTTLLAQVDSSVGGKTGINHRLGKNLIGAFHQPQTVLIDTNVLQTLPAREVAAGMAEVIKYGLIRDAAFLQRLDEIVDAVPQLNGDVISEVIQCSCQHKANVVEADETEQGERATLNLGHTFGHALEALTGYTTYLHGEAVAIGTMMALELSAMLYDDVNADAIQFAENLFVRAGCPVNLRECPVALSAPQIREAMQRDKKVSAGRLKLILLESLGKAVIRNDIDDETILRAIEKRL